MLGFRLIHGYSIFLPRSFCPGCKISIAPIDLIPVVSWLALRGKCRACNYTISYLYPLIEVLTAIIMGLGLIFIPSQYWLYFFIFFTGLIVSIRTDLDQMLISTAATLWLIPIAVIMCGAGQGPINVIQSIFGAILGYFILWSIANIFYFLRKKEGMGEGDFYLLAFIGAFLGPIGAVFSLFLASLFGTIVGIFLILRGMEKDTPMPFGPALALAAIVYSYAMMHINAFLEYL